MWHTWHWGARGNQPLGSQNLEKPRLLFCTVSAVALSVFLSVLFCSFILLRRFRLVSAVFDLVSVWLIGISRHEGSLSGFVLLNFEFVC